MKTLVRDAIADILRREGVHHVFGQTGSHVCSAWEGIIQGGGIATILNKQEGNGAYMADAYARLTRRPGVVVGTTGPGLLNMTTALANAYVDSIPLVVLGAAVPPQLAGKNALQDGSGRGRSPSQSATLRGVCKAVITAPSGAAAPDAVREAFRTAMTGRPGPVVVEISEPYWDDEIEYRPLAPEQYKSGSLRVCPPADCAAIASRLFEARRPVLLLGEAAEESMRPAEVMDALRALGVPFLVAPMAKGLVDEHDPLCVDTLRQLRRPQLGYRYVQEADFVLLACSRLQEYQIQIDPTCLDKKPVAQVDPDPDEIGRVVPIDLAAVGSLASFFAALGGRRHPASEAALRRVDELRHEFPRPGRHPEGDGVHMMNVYQVLEKVAPADAVIVFGSGLTKFMGVNAIRTGAGQTLLLSDSFGPMGYEVPASIGAALATGRPVICLTGDGSFQMACNELATLLNVPARVVFVITNNGGQASLLRWCRKRFGHGHDFDAFRNPDFVALANAYGLRGLRAATTDELEQVLRAALDGRDSALIEVRIDPGSWPA
jgi:acetolactate synthase I/II/III large subunit